MIVDFSQPFDPNIDNKPLDFGKYKGMSPKWLFTKRPDYLLWLECARYPVPVMSLKLHKLCVIGACNYRELSRRDPNAWEEAEDPTDYWDRMCYGMENWFVYIHMRVTDNNVHRNGTYAYKEFYERLHRSLIEKAH